MKSILTTLFLVAVTGIATAGAPASKNPVMPAPAPACPGLNYNYIEAGWLHLDTDSTAGVADGGYLDFSHTLSGNLFADATVGILGGDVDYQNYGAGLGYALPVSDKFDFVGRAGWAYSDTDPGAGEHEAYLSPGFRWQATCNLEIYAKAYLHLPETSDNNWSGGVGAVYNLCPISALSVGYAIGEGDEWSVQAGVRFKL
jgi:hypothetical protein